MYQFADVLRANAEELAMLDATNCGGPVSEMLRDVETGARGIEYFAGLVLEIKGETIPLGSGYLNYTVREPLGVVARIIAYNHPILFATMRCAAPLVAGNSILIKPSEQAPLSTLRLAELVSDIFPPGVFNVLTGGRACGSALSSHMLVRKVMMIGSVPTGKAILRAAADTMKQVGLELGGKNAMIGYPDCDTNLLADAAVAGMNFTWASQSCGSTSRVFLHESHYDAVLGRIIQGCKKYRPGLPTNPQTTMGPLISRAQLDKVIKYIECGKKDGARLVLGGGRPVDRDLQGGFFVEPTVFADVTMDMQIAREEIFGPVLSIIKWSDEDELFRMVNAVDYGLTGSVFTRDLLTAHRAAAKMQAGYIWINHVGPHYLGAPFGGYKQSGLGREECFEEMLSFTQEKNIHVRLKPPKA
jgi:betaine-aldehyde dehydrogenase